MEKIHLALIDSGVGSKQEGMYHKAINLSKSEDFLDKIGHGCAVLYLLNKYCDACIDVYKVVDQSGEVDENRLIDTLELLLDDKNLAIINISMGVTISERRDEMEILCRKLLDKGTVIVSAFDNDGAVSYPAAFDSVIGVDVSTRCRTIYEYEYVESGIVNIRGFGGEQRLPKINGEFGIFSGTSFVAPLITAKIANLMSNGIVTINEIKDALNKAALFVYKKKEDCITYNDFNIERALIFPINKEIHSVLANQDLLSFDIHKVCDAKNFGMVGKHISEIIGCSINDDMVIENINNVDWNEDFDGVILGHTREMNNAFHVDYCDMIIKKCLKFNKKLYAFDDLRNYIKYNQQTMKFPYIDDKHVPKNQFGKLYTLHCPVIGVVGTSSRQGKFTIQLKLRRKFLNNGYKVAQLGTEPTSLLFGMNNVYPMGYDGVCLSDGDSAIITINRQLNQMVKDNTDIVIVGGQSQTTAYAGNNLNLFSLNNLYLLLASQPDIVVICVNVYDEDPYIMRTIKFVEGVVDTEVAAIVISPVLRSLNTSLVRKTKVADEKELDLFKNHIKDITGIPTFILDMENDGQELFEHCVNVLSR